MYVNRYLGINSFLCGNLCTGLFLLLSRDMKAEAKSNEIVLSPGSRTREPEQTHQSPGGSRTSEGQTVSVCDTFIGMQGSAVEGVLET